MLVVVEFGDDVANEKVYNVTKYLDAHPGGAEIVLDLVAKLATTPLKPSNTRCTPAKCYNVLDRHVEEAAQMSVNKASPSSGETCFWTCR
ncbi:hypothetical protein H257_08995 [Aphanomyces astaci]|uniref:Cytochrome b5 heme-binding domain-containing protein n=1 Tax=Aphanomyces astaci TaxID=112090 RepID=W4GDT3_APHAT|nr:hypothetical protein H257_08995 [Aphanomyces astaci]ETV77098.1 hypothetical protein H257_08995 [Aphanomyces astaci]|eukprot:XP_009833404.1 hypothetical protein H257_08995 [Aphanomyces astaci]